MGKTISLCTWNIHFGIELPEILLSIKRNNEFARLDFLILQEASVHNGKEDASIIASQLGSKYSYFQVTAQSLKGIPQANAIIWNTQKIHIETFDVIDMPPFHQTSALHRPLKQIFDKEHKIAVFLKSIIQRRISLIIEGTIYNSTFRLYGVHFDLLGLSSKKKQLLYLLSDTKQRKSVDVEIIAGDINTFKYFKLPSWTSVMKLAASEKFLDVTTEIQWTFSDKRFPKKFPSRHKLDAIFIRSKQKFSYNSWSLPIHGSDHIPVFATMILV